MSAVATPKKPKAPKALKDLAPKKDQDTQLKEQLAKLVEEHGAELDEDDRDFAKFSSTCRWPLLTSENTRAVLLLARFQAGPAKANGKHGLQVTNSAPAERAQNIYGDAVCRLSLKVLDRHPANREPLPADVEARAESIKAKGLLEPIIVRAMPKGRYQILSGETRVLAMKRLTGGHGGEIDARVRSCSDAEALELLAEFNAQRADLTAIDKARLIAKLCEPVTDGGAGLTREQAARIYGMESGGAASNLVRLLELPKVWQDRVASGELEWTWAREILKAVKLPPVMTDLEAHWKRYQSDESSQWNAFRSRGTLNRTIDDWIDAMPRVDEPTDQYGRRVKLKIDADNADIVKQLGIVEVELPTGQRGQTQTVKVATNEKAFEALVQEHVERTSKKNAAKAGQDAPESKREPTAAEKKQKAADRAKTRTDLIAAWRHKLLRHELARRVMLGDDNGLRLVIAYAANPAASWRPPQIDDLLEGAMKGRGAKPRQDHYRKNYWPLVMYAGTLEGAIAEMAEALLKHEAKDWRSPTLPHGLVDDFAADLSVDVAEAWKDLQQGEIIPGGKLSPLLEEFFLLHQTEELRSLCAELKVILPPSVQTRAQMVKLLLSVPQGSNRRLPLPKCIKPVAGVAKPKGKKR